MQRALQRENLREGDLAAAPPLRAAPSTPRNVMILHVIFLLVPVGIEGLVEALHAPEALDLDCKGGTEANPLVSMLMLLFIPSNDGA